MLKFIYSFFLGLLLVIFVGMGVATFYPAPKAPEYPTTLTQRADPGYTPEEKKIDAAYQKQSQDYNKKFQAYNRNVSIIVLVAAIVLLVVSLMLHSRISVLADGLLLGGTFTLVYSIGRSFASEDPKYSFVVVSVGLVVTLAVGYLKFIKPQQAGKKTS